MPRVERLWKFSMCSRCFAVARGTDSVAIPYLMPAQSLNLYTTHPKCTFLILLIHWLVLPVMLSSICLESSPSIVAQILGSLESRYWLYVVHVRTWSSSLHKTRVARQESGGLVRNITYGTHLCSLAARPNSTLLSVLPITSGFYFVN